MENKLDLHRVLVATDFSPHAEIALQQGVWISRNCGAQLSLIHVLPDMRKAILSASPAAQQDMIYGEGNQLQKEISEDSLARMQVLIDKYQASDLNVQCDVLLGDPHVAIIHEVQNGKHDIVLVGTRNLTVWERFIMGSTAKQLIRKCPVPVWSVNAGRSCPPKTVMATTDFSDVSLRGAKLALSIAQQANAEFHLLHVFDDNDMPDGASERITPGHSLRDEINAAAKERMARFLESLGTTTSQVHCHFSTGLPAQEICRIADHLKIDLLVIGTVGRSGIQGVLLGNTAEKVLEQCDCSVLAVKPDGFISPIEPPFWPLHRQITAPMGDN